MAQVQCGDDNGGFLSTKRLLLFHGQLRNEIVCKEMQLRLLGGGGGGEGEGRERRVWKAILTKPLYLLSDLQVCFLGFGVVPH